MSVSIDRPPLISVTVTNFSGVLITQRIHEDNIMRGHPLHHDPTSLLFLQQVVELNYVRGNRECAAGHAELPGK